MTVRFSRGAWRKWAWVRGRVRALASCGPTRAKAPCGPHRHSSQGRPPPNDANLGLDRCLHIESPSLQSGAKASRPRTWNRAGTAEHDMPPGKQWKRKRSRYQLFLSTVLLHQAVLHDDAPSNHLSFENTHCGIPGMFHNR